MKQVLIIGSGISGLTCAIETAKMGAKAILISPYQSERSQSVMAAGGINAVMPGSDTDDSVSLHIKETIDGGCNIAGERSVTALCGDAPHIIEWLESIGVVFTRDKSGGVARRAFGGQSRRRTVYAGASTGKQIVTALVQEARGDGGRLYYLDGGRRVYFMEELYGDRGNLMPRDIVSKCIYDAPSQVYLDITFLGSKKIKENLGEVYDICSEYLGLDVTKESIPVAPSVHFFMGGIAVDIAHRTNIERLYAIGECASIYHGANRLGGNSLLAAVHSGRAAAQKIAQEPPVAKSPGFDGYIRGQEKIISGRLASKSRFPAVYIKNSLAKIMNEDLGILRTGEKLASGIESIDYYLSVSEKLLYHSDVSPYQGYSLHPMLTLGRAVLTCAQSRRETRGAHIRADYPQRSDDFEKCTLISYSGGRYEITYESED